MPRARWFGLAALLLWSAEQFCTAQNLTLRTDVPLVTIPVTITDAHGRIVLGLSESDFIVLDNGRTRSVHVDDPDLVSAPLQLAVLVQTSDISQSALLKIQKIGTMLQDAVAGANGFVALITFDKRVKVVQDFTNDDNAVSAVFRDLKSSDTRDGKMLDGVAEAIQLFERQGNQGARRVLVIIGESKDRGSETTLPDLLVRLQQSNISVYSLAYSAYLTPFTTKGTDYKEPEGGRGWILDAITETIHATKPDTGKLLIKASGGRQLKFETSKKLQTDLMSIGGELHSRYAVSFPPAVEAGQVFHTVQISIRNRPDLHASAQPGYFALLPAAP